MTEDQFRSGDDVQHGPFDYMAECDKTCSTVFRPEQVEVQDIRHILMGIVAFANDLNMVKKLLFRGKTREELNFGAVDGPTLADIIANTPFVGPDIDTLHGAIGVITEAGEVAEALMRWTEGQGFDRVNIMEESGDIGWYVVRMLRGIGVTSEQCDRANIDKLKGRHGGAFDIFRDANRDLAMEHASLDKAFTTALDEGSPTLDLPPVAVVKNPADYPAPVREPSGEMGDMVDSIKAATGADSVGVRSGRADTFTRTPIGDCEGMDC